MHKIKTILRKQVSTSDFYFSGTASEVAEDWLQRFRKLEPFDEPPHDLNFAACLDDVHRIRLRDYLGLRSRHESRIEVSTWIAIVWSTFAWCGPHVCLA